jgi:hypothetical protein
LSFFPSLFLHLTKINQYLYSYRATF